jgi:hypothetical protein
VKPTLFIFFIFVRDTSLSQPCLLGNEAFGLSTLAERCWAAGRKAVIGKSGYHHGELSSRHDLLILDTGAKIKASHTAQVKLAGPRCSHAIGPEVELNSIHMRQSVWILGHRRFTHDSHF